MASFRVTLVVCCCCLLVELGGCAAEYLDILDKSEALRIVRTRRGLQSKGSANTPIRGELSLTQVRSPLAGVPNFSTSCRKIRLRQFIGSKERNCTSIKPVKFSICYGFCLPQFRLQQPIMDIRAVLEKLKHQYRCVPATYRHKKVKVYCGDDGTMTRYRVKVVDSCKCKEFKHQQNEILTPAEKLLMAATAKQAKSHETTP